MPRVSQREGVFLTKRYREDVIMTVNEAEGNIGFITISEDFITNKGSFRSMPKSEHRCAGVIGGKTILGHNFFYSFTITHKIDDICMVRIYFWYISTSGPHEISETVEFDAILSSSKWQDFKLFCYSPQTFFLVKNNTLQVEYAQKEGNKVEIELNDFELISQTTFSRALPVFSYEEGGMFGLYRMYCYLDDNLLLQPLNSNHSDQIDYFIDVINADCLLHVTENEEEYGLIKLFVLSDGPNHIDLFQVFPSLKSCLSKLDFNSCHTMIIYELTQEVFEFALVFKGNLMYCHANTSGTTELVQFSHCLRGNKLFLMSSEPNAFQKMQSFCFKANLPDIFGIEMVEVDSFCLNHYVYRSDKNIFNDFTLNHSFCQYASNNLLVFKAHNYTEKTKTATVIFDTANKTTRIMDQMDKYYSVRCNPIIGNRYILLLAKDTQGNREITYVIDFLNDEINPLIAIPGQIFTHAFDEKRGLICSLQHSFDNDVIYLFNVEGVLLDKIRVEGVYNSNTMFIVNDVILLQNSRSIMTVSFDEQFKMTVEENHRSSPFFCYNPFKKELWGRDGDDITRAYPVEKNIVLNSANDVIDVNSYHFNDGKLVFFSEKLIVTDLNPPFVYQYCDRSKTLEFVEQLSHRFGEKLLLIEPSIEECALVQVFSKHNPLRFVVEKRSDVEVETSVFGFLDMMKTFDVIIVNVDFD
ncbi:hypothetical protein PCE1_003530 [Barthelona sp. PCE]